MATDGSGRPINASRPIRTVGWQYKWSLGDIGVGCQPELEVQVRPGRRPNHARRRRGGISSWAMMGRGGQEPWARAHQAGTGGCAAYLPHETQRQMHAETESAGGNPNPFRALHASPLLGRLVKTNTHNSALCSGVLCAHHHITPRPARRGRCVRAAETGLNVVGLARGPRGRRRRGSKGGTVSLSAVSHRSTTNHLRPVGGAHLQ